MSPDPVDALLSVHGVPGPWEPLRATGVANRIDATQTVVLRVATDHPDAVADALTDSIAAPVARDAGILTPRLIAFDGSRELIDRPFSLWERIHGETLGSVDLTPEQREGLWRAVGRELAQLHNRVLSCPDPKGYLDRPERELNLGPPLKRAADAGRISRSVTRATERLMDELRPHVAVGAEVRFLHNDVHEMNVMGSSGGALLAIIDRGDAGWGDPTLDFAGIPLDAIPCALGGYGSHNSKQLGDCPKTRFIWDRVHIALEDVLDGRENKLPLAECSASWIAHKHLAASPVCLPAASAAHSTHGSMT